MERFKLAAGLLLFLLIYSCGTDTDTEPPLLDILSFSPNLQRGEVCGVTEDVIQVYSGDSLIVVANITDNENLSQYKLDVHNNFDCHGHDGNVGVNLPLPNTNSQTADWTLLDIEEISGREYDLTLRLAVPENATAGLYHFHLQAIDVSGNDVPFSNFYNVRVKNIADTIGPEIQVQQPASNSLTVNRGDAIRFTGTLTDNYSLFEGGNGVLFLSYRDESSGNSFLSANVYQITEELTTYPFDFEFTVPNSLTSGNYTLFLSAFDGVRNVAEARSTSITVN